MTSNSDFFISGNIVDLLTSTIFPGTLKISAGKIVDIIRSEESLTNYIIPGLIDAHIHIESSMLVPSEFARLAVRHGTVAIIADPHEIANVLGIPGITYMIENGGATPFKFYFGAPSCVPATSYETSGATLDAKQIDLLFKKYDLKFLGEMMDYPSVIAGDPKTIAKIKVAQKYGKPVDGHAPGLKDENLQKYVQAGISTDHEAFDPDEAIQKINYGMKILIREGSAAKNFAALHPLISDYSENIMFCSDDKHPDALLEGHINLLIKRALRLGHDKFKILRCASLNPIKHYHLDVGLLQPGDWADFVVIDNFEDFHVLQTYINGNKVADHGECLIPRSAGKEINHFNTYPKTAADFSIPATAAKVKVMEVSGDQLFTKKSIFTPKKVNGQIVSDPDRDILKITVINRYQNIQPAVGLIKNIGLKTGAIASSVSHDSHHIVAIGVTDEAITRAVNSIIDHRGGVAVATDETVQILPLPVAGLMSTEDGQKIAAQYLELANRVRGLGSHLKDPFMTMSFMTLLVIPELKISDRGLFDGEKFKFVPLNEEIS